MKTELQINTQAEINILVLRASAAAMRSESKEAPLPRRGEDGIHQRVSLVLRRLDEDVPWKKRAADESETKSKIHFRPRPLLTQFIEARLHAVLPDHRADEAGLQEGGPAVHQGLLPSFIILDREGMRLRIDSAGRLSPPRQV